MNLTEKWELYEEFSKNSTRHDCTIEDILSYAVDFVEEAIHPESFHIRLINYETNELFLKKGSGIYCILAPQSRKIGFFGKGSAYVASTHTTIWDPNVSFEVIEKSLDNDLSEMQRNRLKQITAYAILPIIFRNKMIGTLCLHFSDDSISCEHSKESLRQILSSFVEKLSNALWQLISARERQELALYMRKFDSKIAEQQSTEDKRIAIIRECTQFMCKLTGATFVFYYENDGAAHILTTQKGLHFGSNDPNILPPQNIPASVGIAGSAVLQRKSQLISNFQDPEWDNQRKSVLNNLQNKTEEVFINWISGMAVIPVIVNNEVDGVFVALTPLPNWFSLDDKNTLESLADKVGACIQTIKINDRLKIQNETLKNLRVISAKMGGASNKETLNRLFLLAITSGYCLRFSQAIVFLNDKTNSRVFNAVHAVGFDSRKEAVSSFHRGARESFSEQIEACENNHSKKTKGALEVRVKDFSINLDEEITILKDLKEGKSVKRNLGESHIFVNSNIIKLLTPANEGDVEYIVVPLHEGEKLVGSVLATRAFLYPSQISNEDVDLFHVLRDSYVQMLKEQSYKQQISTKKNHVFFSYCHDNYEEAKTLYDSLKKAGISLWWDKDIGLGENFKTESRRAMKRSYSVIICLSKELEGRAESGVYQELLEAISNYRQLPPGQSNIIPVLLSKCEIPNIEISDTETLNELNPVSLFIETERANGIKKIVQVLKAHPEHYKTTIPVTIEIDRDFDLFDRNKLIDFIESIAKRLNTKHLPKILNIERGSIKVTIELPIELAKELLDLNKMGRLTDLGVKETKIIGDAAAASIIRQKLLDKKYDVFMCHNSEDKPEVKKIALQLRSRGILPWIDEWELQPGIAWQVEFENQIKNINSAAVFVGNSGFGPWQNMELNGFIRQFVERGCPVIPAILRSCVSKPDIPVFLNGMTWVDFNKRTPNPHEHLEWGITGRKVHH